MRDCPNRERLTALVADEREVVRLGMIVAGEDIRPISRTESSTSSQGLGGSALTLADPRRGEDPSRCRLF